MSLELRVSTHYAPIVTDVFSGIDPLPILVGAEMPCDAPWLPQTAVRVLVPLVSLVLLEVARDARGYRVHVPSHAGPADYRLAATVVEQLVARTKGAVVLPAGTTVPVSELRRWLDDDRIDAFVDRDIERLLDAEGEVVIDAATCEYCFGPRLAARLHPDRPGFRERLLADRLRHHYDDLGITSAGAGEGLPDLGPWEAALGVVAANGRWIVVVSEPVELLLPAGDGELATLPWDVFFSIAGHDAFVRDDRTLIVGPLAPDLWAALVDAATGASSDRDGGGDV